MTQFKQFERYYELVCGDLLIDALDIEFTVKKDLKPHPNTCEIKIYNLNKEHRESLEATKKETVSQLTAGYVDLNGVIFLGDTREIETEYQPPNFITTVTGGEGEKNSLKKRINKCFAKGTPLATVIRDLGLSLDLGLGNLEKMKNRGVLPSGSKEFPNGFTVSGNSARELKRIIKTAGLEWSVQNNQLQILEAGKALETTAIVLDAKSGLIGSPHVDDKGVLTFKALLNSEIIPGKQVEIDSRFVQGRFRLDSCIYTGNTKSEVWFVEGEGKELK